MTENKQPVTTGNKNFGKSQTQGRRSYNKPTSQGNNSRYNPTRSHSHKSRTDFKSSTVSKVSTRGKSAFRRKLTKDEILKLKEKKQRLERIEKTYIRLHEAFPNAFDRKNVKPLKRDIHKEIFEYFNSENEPIDSPVKKSALRSFLTQYIRSDIYHRAVIKYGKRYNLDGSEDLPFTEEEIQYHRDNMSKKTKLSPRNRINVRHPVNRSPSTRNGFVMRQNQGLSFGQKKSKESTTRVSYRGSRLTSNFVNNKASIQSEFNPGDQVLCGGGRTGVVKEVLGSSVKVLLDANKYTILLKQDSIKHLK